MIVSFNITEKGGFGMMPKEDWRRSGQEAYLMGVQLHFVRFAPLSENRDHEHCEFCWAKFYLHPDRPECLREGYCTAEENRLGARWICPECFRDFQEEFGWTAGGDENL